MSELSKQLQDKEAMVAKITEDYKQQEKELMTHVENQSRAIVELKVWGEGGRGGGML